MAASSFQLRTSLGSMSSRASRMVMMAAKMLVTLVLVVCLAGTGIASVDKADASSGGDESILFSEFGRINNQSLLWGPYRPNLYFGVRARVPKSVMMGLMWAKVDDYMSVQQNFRYTCEQHEGMAGYGWDEYDARRGGVQTVHDAGNMIDITTSFVKIPGVTGSAGGGSWGARIKGTPRADAPADGLKTTVLLYLSQEGYDRSGGDVLGVEDTLEDGGDLSLGFDGNVRLAGKSDALGGEYRLVVTRGTGDHPTSNHELSQRRDLSRTVVQTLAAPDEIVWQAKGVVFRQLKDGIDSVANEFEPERAPPPWQVFMLENKPGVGNVHVVQKVFEGPFEFDVLFSSLAAAGAKELTSDDVTREIKANSEAFAAAFDSVFSPRAPFNKGDKAAEYARFGRSMLSNLVGGIGYFYGEQLVDRSGAPEYDEENEGFWEETAAARARHAEQLEGPYELFTAVPSRPFFPRGFLWDEGFHLLPVADWDMDLALDVVRSWYGLMDDDGWIAREQILGPEARSKVPAEFQVQYPHYANPPTLFFIVDIFAERLARAANGTMAAAKEATLRHDAPVASAHLENPELGLDFLRKLYPLLRRQFYWFKRTQYGDIRSYDRRAFSPREAYRWRGRTETHILTSGLDDYPRPQPPHPGELHVDLMSWVGMMARSLAGLADMLGRTEDAEEYRVVLQDIERNLDDLHWSEKEGCYCDATIDEFEEHALVCHKGYVSLFPFLLGLMRHDSPKLGRILQLLADPDELWSDHGIRSLSAKDPLYRTNENYWRSPVWININYLAIAQLHDLALQDGPYRETARSLYSRLRCNVVDTVFASWEETGFAWEQYDPESGKGQRTQHFTGWTSLVVKIMAMDDLSGSKAPAAEHVKDEL